MKRFLAIIMAAAMVFALVACGNNTSGNNASGGNNTSGGDTTGDVETIKIGVVCPISGNSAIAGKYITHGVEVAEEQLGGKIDIKGTEYPVEFIYMDNEANEEKTTNVFQRLIEEDGVIAIVFAHHRRRVFS